MKNPVKYVCQDFRAVFDSSGPYVDKSGAAHLIKLARAHVVAHRKARAEVARERAAIVKLAREIEKLLTNADPQRSP